ncbi:hypothetical protein QFZ63_006587 [Streptomyces sp. B3I7]|nr:hypothetical protein [Streptomyces sp. B3I7]
MFTITVDNAEAAVRVISDRLHPPVADTAG